MPTHGHDNSRIQDYLSALPVHKAGDVAARRLKESIRLPPVWGASKSESRRLLHILFLWLGAVSSSAGTRPLSDKQLQLVLPDKPRAQKEFSPCSESPTHGTRGKPVNVWGHDKTETFIGLHHGHSSPVPSGTTGSGRCRTSSSISMRCFFLSIIRRMNFPKSSGG